MASVDGTSSVVKSQRNENLSQNYIQQTHKKVTLFHIACIVLWKVLYSSR